jgi:hypothetical protein
VRYNQGRNGYRQLLDERKHLAAYMREKLDVLAAAEGERVLHVSSNEVGCSIMRVLLRQLNPMLCCCTQISFALTLATFCSDVTDRQEKSRQLTLLGAMLFSRGVSGAR